ncbi:hypothetical protein DEJ23_11955 [Curtobacterium sp. MCSS17_008]|nr:hypothetical protein DEJ23_11955 [Curtobacterium sp. MCSS17_008]
MPAQSTADRPVGRSGAVRSASCRRPVMMEGVTEPTPLDQRRLRLTSVLPVWVLAVVGAVLVLTLPEKDDFAWLLLVFVLCVLVSFVLQLITATKDGLVERISIASSGAFVVVLVTAVVLLAR